MFTSRLPFTDPSLQTHQFTVESGGTGWVSMMMCSPILGRSYEQIISQQVSGQGMDLHGRTVWNCTIMKLLSRAFFTHYKSTFPVSTFTADGFLAACRHVSQVCSGNVRCRLGVSSLG
jgi:hypothetical protein